MEPYPDDYDALVARNAAQQRSDYKPPLLTPVDNPAEYDLIFIGSPLWNVRLTPPVRSFLSSHDLSGKIIAPFVTYIVERPGAVAAGYRRIMPGCHHSGWRRGPG